MEKFTVYAVSNTVLAYEVEAKSEDEAIDKFWGGEWSDYKTCLDYDIESNEEIIDIKEAV